MRVLSNKQVKKMKIKKAIGVFRNLSNIYDQAICKKTSFFAKHYILTVERVLIKTLKAMLL